MPECEQPHRALLRAYLIPAALLLATFIPGVNAGFWRVDNPLYAAVSKFAYDSGSLWTLHAGDQLYFNKPPLAFWVHGLFLHFLGPELWVSRIPSFFVALATVLLTVDTARRLAGHRAALASGIVLALTLEYFRAMHSISLDLWLALCITGSAWALAAGLGSKRALRWSIAAGLFLGAGLMVKPLIALAALPFFAIWFTVIRERRALTSLALITTVGVIIALPWHISMISLHGDAFTAEYFGSQIVDRVTTDAHGSRPWWDYLEQLASTYWPWLITFLLGLPLLRGERMHKPEQRLGMLSLIFTLGWVAVLSVSSDKAGRYLIPAYPFAAFLSGIWLARAVPASFWEGTKIIRITLAAPTIAMIFALIGISPHDPIPRHWGELREFVRTHPDADFCINPRSRTLGAQLYLMRSKWPAIARWTGDTDPSLRAIDPPAGTLMVSRRSSALSPRPTDEIAFENTQFVVWRLTTDWEGVYSVRPGSALDETDDE
ncbi:MAG: glycosyltransferase family 39 protein [Phycisphaeraceae bacterium]|nr:glycosyltransferase family 39 protein [Phycisphaerales bacterium]MCB9843042.1 glycosyltransferase family 39 protein [Phycisphaeraceae bacterium]